MMTLRKTAANFAMFLALSLCLVSSGLEQKRVKEFSNEDKGALSQEMNDAIVRGDSPGVVSLVVNRDGVLYEGAAGKLDIAHNEAMPVDAIFAIASMTKPVTSVAIMNLIEAGKLKLDDPVSKYLTGFDNLRVITNFNDRDATYETRPARRPITIRHLLTNTSGFAYSFCNPIEDRLVKANHKDEWEQPLLNDPGDKWNYSPSTAVLGMVVEKISGQPLESYFQQHIFQPLGMVDTSYAVPLAKQPRVATKYRRKIGRFEDLPRSNIPATPTAPFRGDGGLYSTVQDYGRFMRMLLNGGRLGSAQILKESSVRMMGKNNIGSIFVQLQPAVDPSFAKPFPLGAGHDKFGLGFQIASSDPEYAKFRSAGSMSWAGIYNTEFWIDPAQHIGGVMMMQMLPFYDGGALRTLRDFEQLVYQKVR
jgi:methyl acetate hydrolase